MVLPVLGPSTVRDTAGSVINVFGGDPWYNVSVKNDTRYFNEKDYYISRGTDGINFKYKRSYWYNEWLWLGRNWGQIIFLKCLKN